MVGLKMTKKEILEGNKLIADFMNYRQDKKDPQVFHLKGIEKSIGGKVFYHSSWDWLMMVVDRIDLIHPHGRTFIEGQRDNPKKEIVNWWCNLGEAYHHSTISKIDAVYQAVIKFIRWFNENKKE